MSLAAVFLAAVPLGVCGDWACGLAVDVLQSVESGRLSCGLLGRMMCVVAELLLVVVCVFVTCPPPELLRPNHMPLQLWRDPPSLFLRYTLPGSMFIERSECTFERGVMTHFERARWLQ